MAGRAPREHRPQAALFPETRPCPATPHPTPPPKAAGSESNTGREGSLPREPQPLFPWQPLFQDKAETQNYPHTHPGGGRRQSEGPGHRVQRGN